MRGVPVLGLALMLMTGGGVAGQSPEPSLSAGPSASAEPATGQAGDLPDLDAIFSPSEPPIDLAIVQDEAVRTSVDVPAEGGTVEATAADGTRFTLVIPDGALTGPTTIGMAPLASVEGIPFGEPQVHAVQLEPSGLLLLEPATLTIEPATPLAVDEQILFGFDGAGSGMFLAEPVVTSPAIEIVVTHFSGYGVQKGLLADTGPERARLGGDAERRIGSQLAEALAAERQRQQSASGGDPADLAAVFGDAFERFDAEVVQPRIAAAGESCANARLAMATYLSFERQKQLAGMGDDEGTPQLDPLLRTLTRVCVQEEYELCRDEHVIHRMLPVILSMERTRQLMGVDDPEGTQSDKDLAKRCLTFRLDFESNITVEQGAKLEPSVRAKVPLEADIDALEIKGTDVQEMFAFKVKVPKCQATPHPADADFEVLSLTWSVEGTIWDQSRGRISDYTLDYHPGFAKESVTIACPRIPPIDAQFSLWYPAYIVAHESEWRGNAPGATTGRALAILQGGIPDFSKLQIRVPKQFNNRLTLKGWEVQEAPLLARQTWVKHALKGRVTDVGSFELFHTPG